MRSYEIELCIHPCLRSNDEEFETGLQLGGYDIEEFIIGGDNIAGNTPHTG